MKLTQPLISWVSKALFIAVKWSMNKSTHSRPRGAENMNTESYTPTFPSICFNRVVFKKWIISLYGQQVKINELVS